MTDGSSHINPNACLTTCYRCAGTSCQVAGMLGGTERWSVVSSRCLRVQLREEEYYEISWPVVS